jgi:hypothetical protein
VYSKHTMSSNLEKSRIEQTQEKNGDFYSYKITELENGGFRRVLHSVGDEPAVRTSRCYEWYCDGKLHREGGKPARAGHREMVKNGVVVLKYVGHEYWNHGVWVEKPAVEPVV